MKMPTTARVAWLGLLVLLPATSLAQVAAANQGATTTPAANAAQGRERDLGMGLAYHRIHALPADLPPAAGGRPPPCVVDLRFVQTHRAGITAFQKWAMGRTSVHSPVFVLVNGATDGELLALLRSHEWAPGLMTIGIATRNFRPDVAVEAAAADERTAYDAFEQGATMASLLDDHPGKIRYDETSLGKDRRAEQPARSAEAAKENPPARKVDPVLQRAVHLHRALLALKRL
jgi:hypothetical protein